MSDKETISNSSVQIYHDRLDNISNIIAINKQNNIVAYQANHVYVVFIFPHVCHPGYHIELKLFVSPFFGHGTRWTFLETPPPRHVTILSSDL